MGTLRRWNHHSLHLTQGGTEAQRSEVTDHSHTLCSRINVRPKLAASQRRYRGNEGAHVGGRGLVVSRLLMLPSYAILWAALVLPKVPFMGPVKWP